MTTLATLLLILIIVTGLVSVYTQSRPGAIASGALASVLFAAWAMLLNEGFSVGHLFDNWNYPALTIWTAFWLFYGRAKVQALRARNKPDDREKPE